MADESDGLQEAIETQMRELMSAARQAGEMIRQAREDLTRLAQEFGERQASRADSERGAARAELNNVFRAEWWESATPEKIAGAYQVAQAWPDEPQAMRASEKIRDEVRDRYGIDVAPKSSVNSEPLTRELAESERQRGKGDAAEAGRLTSEADRADRMADDNRSTAAEESHPDGRVEALEQAHIREGHADAARDAAQPLYDSAERRTQAANELEKRGVEPDAVRAKVHADVSQATPATTATRARRPPRARNTRGRGRARGKRNELKR